MTVIDDPFEPNDPSDAALDRLLAQAQWDIPVDAEECLRDRWIALNRKRRMTVPLYGMLAAAAAILLAIGTILLVRDHASLVTVTSIVPETDDVKYLVIRTGIESSSSHIESRPATLVEQLTLMQGSPAVTEAPKPIEPPKADPAVVALTQQLGDGNLENRFAAAQQLAKMDDPFVVPALAEMVRQGINAREALLALKLSKNPVATETLNGLALSSASRAQLAADTLEIQSRL